MARKRLRGSLLLLPQELQPRYQLGVRLTHLPISAGYHVDTRPGLSINTQTHSHILIDIHADFNNN